MFHRGLQDGGEDIVEPRRPPASECAFAGKRSKGTLHRIECTPASSIPASPSQRHARLPQSPFRLVGMAAAELASGSHAALAMLPTFWSTCVLAMVPAQLGSVSFHPSLQVKMSIDLTYRARVCSDEAGGSRYWPAACERDRIWACRHKFSCRCTHAPPRAVP